MLHFNYDSKQENGVVYNTLYPNGALFIGAEYKPTLTFPYADIQYSEVFVQHFVRLNNELRTMTLDEQAELITVATNWVQPLGQEGNPTLEQAIEFKLNEITTAFNIDVTNITTALPHEMTSWTKQETQARAWIVDNTTVTPIIDALLISRNMSETKEELINKIIAKADAHEVLYGQILGKFHNREKALELATTVEELKAISW